MTRVEIARKVIAGYYGSGSKRTEALRKAGFDPETVQGDVNTLLCCRENIINNIKAQAISIANNNNWWYIYWNEQYGRECAICHPHNGNNHGWQCIGFVIACWHHGGLPIPCNCGVIDNGTGEKILKAKTDAEALKTAQNHLKINDIQVLRDKKGIAKSKTRPGDMGLLFDGENFQHMILIMSDKKIADSTHGKTKSDDIRADRSFSGRYVSRLKVIIRYTGNGLCSAPKRSIDELAHEVLDGLWGSGDSRKKALTEAGHDYDAVQTRVNEILNPKPSVKIPSLHLIKTNAQVIADAITWACWIAGDNDFHYGHGQAAHHNGCYFCGTEPKSKKNAGIVDWERTYCCNPFIGAAWAHGGCVPKALELCQKGTSWDFNSGRGYDASKLFDNLGKPAKSKLRAGDVLCSDIHVALYIGNGKIAEASGGDDNIRGSKKWNNSIHTATLTDARYEKFKRVHRFNGSVDKDLYIRNGEISDRVADLQSALSFFGYDLKTDRIFGSETFKALKDFQKDHGLVSDGIAGPATIKAFEDEVNLAERGTA